VAENSVAVWVALRDAATVELTVWPGLQRSTGPGQVEGGAAFAAQGTAPTKRFGAKLHVAVVVATSTGPPIAPGAIFSYDLRIGADNLRTLKLLQNEQAASRLPGVDPSAPLHLALGYELDRLPSFATPAPLIADLRLVHTSCRRTNSDGPDAMAYLDDLVAAHRSDPVRRPQQLFLTGDQIYADDLSACLLKQVNAIGTELTGFTEKLPISATQEVTVDLTNFPAMRRRRVVRDLARFSTGDGLQHLLSYGEFLALHLLSWSPRLWRALATKAEVFADVPQDRIDAHHLQDWVEQDKKDPGWLANAKADFDKYDVPRTAVFRAAVPRVARALANTATYMIFDDHEVTDDWYLSKSWRSEVLTAPNGFGRAILRNAYGAYMVCQGWGNDPAAFTHTGAASNAPKNEILLDTLTAIATDGAVSVANRNKLDELLGLTSPSADPQTTFHYKVPGPKHMVRVLDTRSRRTFRGRLGPPKLLGSSLDAQLPAGPLTDGRELLVVVSAAPVLMPRIFDTLIQPAAAQVIDFLSNVVEKAKPGPDGPPITGAEKFDLEGWGADEDTLETMIRRLATYPRAIVLSGDIHFAGSIALDYWKKDDNQLVDARIVQLTCSPARNDAGAEKQAAIRSSGFSQQLLRGLPFERLAWEDKAPVTVPAGKAPKPARLMRMQRKPSLLPARGWPGGTSIPTTKPPDWRWRMTVLRDDRPRAQIGPLERQPPPLPAFNAGDPLATYDQIAGVHAQLALGQQDPLRLLVFRTNLGLVRFETAPQLTVVHELLSMDAPDATTGHPYTQHRASLALDPALTPPVLVADG
jgi:hypothetical protein